MTLLGLRLRPGQPIFDQLLFAAKRALVSREFRPGQAFPSVRTLAADLKIHPNTAHKVVQFLIEEGWLESRPGLGTVVADGPEPPPSERSRILGEQVEQLVVEAKRLRLDLDEVTEAIESQWMKLDRWTEVNKK